MSQYLKTKIYKSGVFFGRWTFCTCIITILVSLSEFQKLPKLAYSIDPLLFLPWWIKNWYLFVYTIIMWRTLYRWYRGFWCCSTLSWIDQIKFYFWCCGIQGRIYCRVRGFNPPDISSKPPPEEHPNPYNKSSPPEMSLSPNRRYYFSKIFASGGLLF